MKNSDSRLEQAGGGGVRAGASITIIFDYLGQKSIFLILKRMEVKKSKNVIFTSCGDRSNCHELWFNSSKNFDSICVYYGNNEKMFETYNNKFDITLRVTLSMPTDPYQGTVDNM